MNSLTSIFSLEPEPILQWRVDLRYVPTKEDFLSGERAFVYVYGVSSRAEPCGNAAYMSRSFLYGQSPALGKVGRCDHALIRMALDI